MAKPRRTKAGAQILKGMREVLEHLEGKRVLRTTIVDVDRAPKKASLPLKRKTNKRK